MFDFSSFISTLVSRINPTPQLAPVILPGARRWLAVHHKDYVTTIADGARDVRAAHVFLHCGDLAEWLVREATQKRWDVSKAAVLVDEDNISAIDDTSVQWPCVVTCPLEWHPYWAMWMALADGKERSSAMLFDALRPLASTFAPVGGNGGEPIPGAQFVLGPLKTIMVNASADVDTNRGDNGLVTRQVKSARVTTSADLPATWALRMPVFDAAPDIVVDVEAIMSCRYNRDDGDIYYRLRIPLASLGARQAREQLVEQLRRMLPGWYVGQGEAKTAKERLD